MTTNIHLEQLIALLHVLVLLFSFFYLFTKIFTTPGGRRGVQLCLLMAFFGVCTLLGAAIIPSVVCALWLEIGRLALPLGWIGFSLLEASYDNS